MSGPVDVRGILERAGADAAAPEGSQAWALAQVDDAVAGLIEADAEFDRAEIAMNRESGYSDAHIAAIRAFRAASERRRAALTRCRGEA